MSKPEVIKIDEVEYVRRDSLKEKSEPLNGMEYCIVRTQSAGVFAGYVEKLYESEGVRIAVIRKSRRIWFWDGAASLSQLAEEGTKKPENCKFPCEVEKTELSQVIEVISVSKKAKTSIQGVKVWEQ